VLYSCHLNGANGYLAWCWQDFRTEAYPYALKPNERFIGITDLDYRLKPQGKEHSAFARTAARLPPPSSAPTLIGLYIHDTYFADHLHNWGRHDTEQEAIAYFHSYLLLKRAHHRFEITREINSRYKLLIIPCLFDIQMGELKKLVEFVREGGTLYISMGDYILGYLDLFGLRALDFTVFSRPDSFTFQGVRFPVQPKAGKRAVVEKAGQVLSTLKEHRIPAFLRQRLGKGQLFLLTTPLEREMNTPHFFRNNRMHRLYEFIAREAGVEKELDCNDPEVEMELLEDGRVMLVNHSDRTRRVLLRGTKEKVLMLPSCGVGFAAAKK